MVRTQGEQQISEFLYEQAAHVCLVIESQLDHSSIDHSWSCHVGMTSTGYAATRDERRGFDDKGHIVFFEVWRGSVGVAYTRRYAQRQSYTGREYLVDGVWWEREGFRR